MTRNILALACIASGLFFSNFVLGGSATWSTTAGSGDWNTATNWTPNTVPNGAADRADFGLSSTTAISLSSSVEIESMGFALPASAYTFTAPADIRLTLSGRGIFSNNSGLVQNFVTGVDGAGNRGIVEFDNSAFAGGMTVFTNNGAIANSQNGGATLFNDSSHAGTATINNNGGAVGNANGGEAIFAGSASAESASILNSGGAVNNASGGITEFHNNSTAGNATIMTHAGEVSGAFGGDTHFFDNSNAGTAMITNNGGQFASAQGALLQFADTSSADNATIINNPAIANATAGSTYFYDTTTAGNSSITNKGSVVSGDRVGVTDFFTNSTAGSANITNEGGTVASANGGLTRFDDNSMADSATITNNGGTASLANGGSTEFFSNSTAASASFMNNGAVANGAGGGFTLFNDTSTAANATFTNNGATISGGGGGATRFVDSSSADHSNITNNGAAVSGASGGFTQFNNDSTAANATVTNQGGTASGVAGGSTEFLAFATAANSTITSNGGMVSGALGGQTIFDDSSNADAATLIANGGASGADGGRIRFEGSSLGGTSRVEVFGNGNLDISAHFASGVTVGSIEGDGDVFLGARNLMVGSNDMSTAFSGAIQDGGLGGGTGGSLTKIGTGTLILSGNNSYTGDTNINAGTLQLDGFIKSQTYVNPGGTLSGTGSINQAGITSSGVVSPGDNGPGTLGAEGTYMQNSDGMFRIEIGGLNSGVNSDLLNVGEAHLDGTLQLLRINNFLPHGGDMVTILTANPSDVFGQFSAVTGDFQGLLQPDIIYDTHDVIVEFIQNSFNIGGLTRNQQSVANELNEVVNDPRAGNLIDFLDFEPLGNLPPEYDLIAPEELASIYEMGFTQANMQGVNLMQRMDDIRAGSTGFCSSVAMEMPTPSYSKESNGKEVINKNPAPAFVPTPENRWGIWVTGSGQFVNVGNDDDNATGYDLSNGNFTVGIDYRLLHNLAFGIYGGYDAGVANLVNDGRITTNGGNVGGFATWSLDRFYVDVSGGGTWNNYKTRRAALLGDAVGSTQGAQYNVHGALGYDWHFGCWNVGPRATFQYTDVNIDQFRERGSLAPLNFPDQNEDSLQSTVGFRASYDLHPSKNIIIRPELSAAWLHEYNDRAYPIDAGLASGAGDVFTVWGPTVGRDGAQVRAGASAQLNRAFSIYVYYDGLLGRGNYENNGVSGGFTWSF